MGDKLIVDLLEIWPNCIDNKTAFDNYVFSSLKWQKKA